MKNFYGSIIFTAVCLVAAAALGYDRGGIEIAGKLLFLTVVLGIMETSLSLDNAVVNATVLKDMSYKWQRRFLTWGILIAVFGMRIVFPIAIVSFAGWISPVAAVELALTDQQQYEAVVTGAHIGISGFGGAFLMLVGISFFVAGEKEHHWIPILEKPAMLLDRIPFAPYLLAAVIVLGVSLLCADHERQTFLLAGAGGIATYWAVEKLGELMSVEDETGVVVRSGAAGFVYLEFLDASFSFDGVIGAFAITNDILVIALGLGIGAIFVRSMTIALVRGGHMAQFRYLEHGAFWAIIALATIMLISVRFEVPEVITGLIGAVLIALSWRWSIIHRRRHPGEYLDDTEGEAVLPTGKIV